MSRKRVRQRTSKTSFNSDSQGCPGRGSGWREEPARHSLAARGIRTTYDELQDRNFSPNYRSLAALMRDKRLNAMRRDLDMSYDSSLTSRDSFINEKSLDQRKLMEIYRRNNQIPGGVPRFQARGIFSRFKRKKKGIGRQGPKVTNVHVPGSPSKISVNIPLGGRGGVTGAAKSRLGKLKSKIGGGAKKIGEGAKKIGGVVKRGAQAVGGVVTKGSTWMRSKFEPRTYIVNPKRYRQTNDMMGDNLARRMNIDELMAEEKRLDQSNRALMMQMGMRGKWNNKRGDILEDHKRIYSREGDYRKLQSEMFK